VLRVLPGECHNFCDFIVTQPDFAESFLADPHPGPMRVDFIGLFEGCQKCSFVKFERESRFRGKSLGKTGMQKGTGSRGEAQRKKLGGEASNFLDKSHVSNILEMEGKAGEGRSYDAKPLKHTPLFQTGHFLSGKDSGRIGLIRARYWLGRQGETCPYVTDLPTIPRAIVNGSPRL
jgi:hypothetical protein